MPIYLVRWPGFSLSLVRARDEEELCDMLDEVADPGACRWTVYRGPLWFDLDLPLNFTRPDDGSIPTTEDELKVVGIERLVENGIAHEVSIGGEDTASEMLAQINRWGFPHLAELFDGFDIDSGDGPTPADVLAAARLELREFVKYEWRARQIERRSDPEATMLRVLGLTAPTPWMQRQLDDVKGKRDRSPPPATVTPIDPTPRPKKGRAKARKGSSKPKTPTKPKKR